MESKRSVEAAGDNVEDAIAKGLSELGVGPSEVLVEVLDEGSRGVFGLGARQAKVRLNLLSTRPPAPPPPAPAPPSKPTRQSESYIDDVDDEDDEEAFMSDQIALSDDEITDDDARIGKGVLEELLQQMGVKANITVRRAQQTRQEEQTPWLLDVSGKNMNVLIGRRGETLAALQYITRLISSRRLQRRSNIIVDVDGYKQRRSKMLRSLAKRMADQAVQQHRTVSLEPMPPHERRIIHLTLRERGDVSTRSVGDGDTRKVTIIPKP